MTGKTSIVSSSVLPLDARTARIAAGGGLHASLTASPVTEKEPSGRYRVAGLDPDGLDFPVPHAADSRRASSFSVPRTSVPSEPVLNCNPT